MTIHLKTQVDPWEIQVRVLQVSGLTCVGTLNAAFAPERPEDAIPDLARALIGLLVTHAVAETRTPPPLYHVPAGTDFPYYLLRLEQLLTVRCGAMEGVPASFLSGERAIIDGNLALCLARPENLVTRILLLQTSSTLKKIRPDVVAEFKDHVARLQSQHPFAEPAKTAIDQLLSEIADVQ